ncbi:MAG: hypothetical protein GDA53_09355 [Rhodobacteraceae bacterium]|nr:hypothetical protein [Paracoccaceae bacterium]
MSARGYRRTEPPELALDVETPTVLAEILRLHFEDLGYSISDLDRALCSSAEDLRTLHPLPGGAHRLRVVK